MVKDKVTKADLQRFAVGQQEVFVLPNWDKAKSAASYAYQMKNKPETYGWQFSAKISNPIEGTLARTVTITRLS